MMTGSQIDGLPAKDFIRIAEIKALLEAILARLEGGINVKQVTSIL